MPFKSSAITIASPSINGRVKFVVLGVRCRVQTIYCGVRLCVREARFPIDRATWKGAGLLSFIRDNAMLRRLSQACDAGDIFGAGAAVALGMPAIKQRFRVEFPSDIQCAHAFRAVQACARKLKVNARRVSSR